MEGLDWTNLWLGILAILSLIEFLMIAAVALLAYGMYRKAAMVIESIEQRHVVPLRAKAEAVIAEAQMVVNNGKEIVGRVKDAEESVAEALKHAVNAGILVVGSVRSKAWPILGIVQGVRVAVKAMLNGRSTNGRSVRDEPFRTHTEAPHPQGGIP
jgi:hypothetical protein